MMKSSNFDWLSLLRNRVSAARNSSTDVTLKVEEAEAILRFLESAAVFVHRIRDELTGMREQAEIDLAHGGLVNEGAAFALRDAAKHIEAWVDQLDQDVISSAEEIGAIEEVVTFAELVCSSNRVSFYDDLVSAVKHLNAVKSRKDPGR